MRFDTLSARAGRQPGFARPGGRWQPTSRIALLLTGLLLGASMLGGCISNRRLVYMQDDALSTRQTIRYESIPPQYRLQAADVLNIQVRTTESEVNTLFSATGAGFMNFADPASQYTNGYIIDPQGVIHMPIVGDVRVGGQTLEEANRTVQQKVSTFLRDAYVTVRIVSFKITILGEVTRAGYYYIQNEQCTILEALGQGGDLTTIANRNRVKIIRQNGRATEVALVDLTDANLVRSPYYFLQPNDVVYVEPLSGQTPRANLAPITLTIGVISGLVTTTLLIVSLRNR